MVVELGGVYPDPEPSRRKKPGSDRHDKTGYGSDTTKNIQVREPSTCWSGRPKPVRLTIINALWIFLGQPGMTACPKIMRLTCVSEGVALVLVGQDPLGEVAQ